MSKIYQKTFPAGKNAGFTLIELLVVVLIIGILAAVALPQYQMAVKKARLMKAAPLVKAIANAEEVYWMSNNQYTPKIEDLDVAFPPGLSLAGVATDSGFVKLDDRIVIDLLTGKEYITDSRSVCSFVEAILDDTIRYRQYLQNSAYPGRRACLGDAALCKSLGGTLSSGGDQWVLP